MPPSTSPKSMRKLLAVPWGMEHGADLRRQLRTALAELSVPRQVAGDLEQAVGEGFANGVQKERAAPGQRITLSVEVSATEVVLELCYPGNPFPLPDGALPALESESGRGVPMMMAYTDRLAFMFNEGTIRVLMVKNLG